MTKNRLPRKMHISGAFSFISQDNLASQLIDVYFEMKQLPPESVYRLYVHFDFLDSKAKKLIFRFLTILDAASKKASMPSLRIHFLYNWENDDMQELGYILAEHLSADTVHVCQVDHNVLKSMRVA
jgi:hypothetical protein